MPAASVPIRRLKGQEEQWKWNWRERSVRDESRPKDSNDVTAGLWTYFFKRGQRYLPKTKEEMNCRGAVEAKAGNKEVLAQKMLNRFRTERNLGRARGVQPRARVWRHSLPCGLPPKTGIKRGDEL